MDGEPLCDLLCVAAHTDDAELSLGATLRLLADRGRCVWVCDLTRGELGSNADPDERWGEAGAASAVLRLAGRLQLALPDGFLSADRPEQVAQVAATIRLLRPRWIVAAPAAERHPDHLAVAALVRKGAFMAGLISFATGEPAGRWWPAPPDLPAAAERWRAEAVLEVCPLGAAPSILFDAGPAWAAKRQAIACYASQFDLRPGRVATRLNDPAFLEGVEHRGRTWGRLAGLRHAEALRGDAAMVLDDLPPQRWSRGGAG